MEDTGKIEEHVTRAMNSARNRVPVELPPFFAEKAWQKIRKVQDGENRFSFASLLKVAAVIALAVINIYTIMYIGGARQQAKAVSHATMKDFLNDYQPHDSTELTIENNINNE